MSVAIFSQRGTSHAGLSARNARHQRPRDRFRSRPVARVWGRHPHRGRRVPRFADHHGGRFPRPGLHGRWRLSVDPARQERPWPGRDRSRRRRCQHRRRGLRARRCGRSTRFGWFGRHHDRHIRHASVAAGSAQADGQHTRIRPDAPLRGWQRHPDAELGGRHRGHQPHQPPGPGRSRAGDGGHGDAEPQKGV